MRRKAKREKRVALEQTLERKIRVSGWENTWMIAIFGQTEVLRGFFRKMIVHREDELHGISGYSKQHSQFIFKTSLNMNRISNPIGVPCLSHIS